MVEVQRDKEVENNADKKRHGGGKQILGVVSKKRSNFFFHLEKEADTPLNRRMLGMMCKKFPRKPIHGRSVTKTAAQTLSQGSVGTAPLFAREGCRVYAQIPKYCAKVLYKCASLASDW